MHFSGTTSQRDGQPTVTVTIETDDGERVGSFSLTPDQANKMAKMLGLHIWTKEEGNWIDDSQDGVYFISGGYGDPFAVGSECFEILVPYADCKKLRKVVWRALKDIQSVA